MENIRYQRLQLGIPYNMVPEIQEAGTGGGGREICDPNREQPKNPTGFSRGSVKPKTMNATIVPGDWPLTVPVNKPTTLLLDNSILDVAKYISTGRLIAYTVEPPDIVDWHIQAFLLENHQLFDKIITDQEALSSLPNAILLPMGLPWFANDTPPAQKKFGVSTIVGRKAQTVGHKLRHELWERQGEVMVPKAFYRSHLGSPDGFPNAPVLYQDKTPVFDWQFHICIENSFSKYYFTEKITDCFRMKSVPIYWGATNVADYFDIRGIIQVHNMDGLICACNSLTPELYKSMLPYIEANHTESAKYIELGLRVSGVL